MMSPSGRQSSEVPFCSSEFVPHQECYVFSPKVLVSAQLHFLVVLKVVL
jgi:hypothetical protein